MHPDPRGTARVLAGVLIVGALGWLAAGLAPAWLPAGGRDLGAGVLAAALTLAGLLLLTLALAGGTVLGAWALWGAPAARRPARLAWLVAATGVACAAHLALFYFLWAAS